MNKKRKYPLNIYNVLGLLIAAFFIYFLLLGDSEFPFSIRSVLGGVHHFVNHWPILIVGLLPVYVALMIFGIAILGLYLGSLLERLIARITSKKTS